MFHCFVLTFIALSGWGHALTDEEKAEKVLADSIAAASIVRVQGEYDNATSCVWPECAPLCEDCRTKGVGSCMVPGVNECPWSAKCTLGSCFCGKGYCARGSQCKFRTCRLGARPPKLGPSKTVQQLSDLASSLPSQASLEEWKDFTTASMKLPVILFCLGTAMGLFTCCCIFGKCECELQWMPTSPIILLVLCLVTVAAISVGVVSRAMVVSQSMDLIGTQISRVETSLKSSVSLADELQQMAKSFQDVVDDLPNSCNQMVPGARDMMAMASEKANAKLLQMKQKVDAFSTVAHTATDFVGMLRSQEWTAKVLVITLPMVPLILMALWTLAIAVAVLVSWCSRDPTVAKKADDLVIDCGAPMTCCLMMISVLLASIYLWVGLVTAGVCMDLDANVISLIHNVNFTEVSKFKYNIDPILEGAAKYYIEGSQENPMISMIEDVERDASALYTVYTNATWATKPAEMVCNGVKNLNASEALAACQESVSFARELLSAGNMFPYYNTLAHELMCDKMLQGMVLLIFLSAAVSIVLMPLVAICADVDLRKWETYKEENFGLHYETGMHEMLEKSPFLGGNGHMGGWAPQGPFSPHGNALPWQGQT